MTRLGCWLGACMAIGQVWAAGLEFEVASVRSVPPSPPELALARAGRPVGMTVSGGRVSIPGVALNTLIAVAFRVPQNQVTGPDWMITERFDIQATLPAGASEDQIPEMLQSLLANRFKLVVHRENKEQSLYALVVAKGGLKVTPSTAEPDAPAAVADGDPNAPPPPPSPVMPLGRAQVRIKEDANGGTLSGPLTGTVRGVVDSKGTLRLEAPNITFEGLADLLTQFIREPVMDMTGLKGRYQMVLEIARPTNDAMPQAQGGAGGAGVPNASDPTGNPFLAAVQKLGLKLESRKLPVEVIVVDHLERAPTEN